MRGRLVWGAWIVFIVASWSSLDISQMRRVLFPPTDDPPINTRGDVPGVPRGYVRCPLCFLSTAAADSLRLLPGIGPVLAARIVTERRSHGPYASWDEFRSRVAGIGEKSVARLKRESQAFPPVIGDHLPAAE